MDWSKGYTDTCAELRILEIREMELRRRVEIAHKVIVTGEAPSSGDYCHIPLDKGIERYNKAVDELTEFQTEVDRMKGIKVQMEDAMAKCTDLGNRIKYERLVNGKTYKQLALEMGYTEQYLRVYNSRRVNKQSTQSAS